MELKKAVAELRGTCGSWKIRQVLGGEKTATVTLDYAISVAETLLAALETPDLTKPLNPLYQPTTPPNWRAAPPAERPPEKGDWVTVIGALPEGKWMGVWQVAEDTGYYFYLKGREKKGRDGWSSENLRIVRRAADPLRVGDKVAFGSKKGKVIQTLKRAMQESFGEGWRAEVRFTTRGRAEAWFDTEDLTLLEPVYDRPAEKGDC